MNIDIFNDEKNKKREQIEYIEEQISKLYKKVKRLRTVLKYIMELVPYENDKNIFGVNTNKAKIEGRLNSFYDKPNSKNLNNIITSIRTLIEKDKILLSSYPDATLRDRLERLAEYNAIDFDMSDSEMYSLSRNCLSKDRFVTMLQQYLEELRRTYQNLEYETKRLQEAKKELNSSSKSKAPKISIDNPFKGEKKEEPKKEKNPKDDELKEQKLKDELLEKIKKAVNEGKYQTAANLIKNNSKLILEDMSLCDKIQKVIDVNHDELRAMLKCENPKITNTVELEKYASNILKSMLATSHMSDNSLVNVYENNVCNFIFSRLSPGVNKYLEDYRKAYNNLNKKIHFTKSGKERDIPTPQELVRMYNMEVKEFVLDHLPQNDVSIFINAFAHMNVNEIARMYNDFVLEKVDTYRVSQKDNEKIQNVFARVLESRMTEIDKNLPEEEQEEMHRWRIAAICNEYLGGRSLDSYYNITFEDEHYAKDRLESGEAIRGAEKAFYHQHKIMQILSAMKLYRLNDLKKQEVLDEDEIAEVKGMFM